MERSTGQASRLNGAGAPAPARRRGSYYTASEIADDFVGISRAHFYRAETRERLYIEQKLPRPYCEKPLRWDRRRMDAWKLGDTLHREGIPPAANDDGPLSMEQRRERLAAIYQQRAAQ